MLFLRGGHFIIQPPPKDELNLWMRFPPGVPSILSLFEKIEVLLMSYTISFLLIVDII